MLEICLKLIIKTSERRELFFVNFEQVSDIYPVFPLMFLNR